MVQLKYPAWFWSSGQRGPQPASGEDQGAVGMEGRMGSNDNR